MIKTIIATSDWHIRPLNRHDEYNEVFDNFIQEVKDERPDRVVIAGDLLHSKITVTNESQMLVGRVLNALTEYTKVIIIPGNHDAIINSKRIDSITPIVTMINNPNILYYKESGCFLDKWDSDIVWCVWSCLENQKTPNIAEFRAEQDSKGEKQYIGLYHGVIMGSTTDVGFSFTDDGVDPAEFYETDIFIAGDIHKHQTYTYKNYKGKTGTGIMIGSLIQQNFGESLGNHGYVKLTYNKGWKHELIDVDNNYNFHTLQLTDFEKINEL